MAARETDAPIAGALQRTCTWHCPTARTAAWPLWQPSARELADPWCWRVQPRRRPTTECVPWASTAVGRSNRRARRTWRTPAPSSRRWPPWLAYVAGTKDGAGEITGAPEGPPLFILAVAAALLLFALV